jgi:hypothetical protein
MAKFRGERDAFGRPGMEPQWTQGNKEGVGTGLLGRQPRMVHGLEPSTSSCFDRCGMEKSLT